MRATTLPLRSSIGLVGTVGLDHDDGAVAHRSVGLLRGHQRFDAALAVHVGLAIAEAADSQATMDLTGDQRIHDAGIVRRRVELPFRRRFPSRHA